MNDAQELRQRIRELETSLVDLRRSYEDLARTHDDLRQAHDELRRSHDDLRQTLAEREARIEELEEELRKRGKNYRPKPNRKKASAKVDRRKKPHRKHGGEFRQLPDDIPDDQLTHHDVYPDACTCGCRDFLAIGEFDDHFQVDIPEPKPEYHRFRRHMMKCRDCGKLCQGRGEMELAGGHVGPRVRLLACYARGYLGISLGKTCTLLQDLWGIPLSRAGALGHLKWGSRIMAPVVAELLELLKQADVIHADETGWRIDGKNVWAWCFSNPDLAVFLIKHSRSRQVFIDALGDTLPGVLVCDFYAAYNGIKADKQRCLTHLLRELHDLSERLAKRYVTEHIRPLITLFQDAIALAKRRPTMTDDDYVAACDSIYNRFGDAATRDSRDKDVRRILKRLNRHMDELFTFLVRAEVPPDNNMGERDIRSVAAARGDGGVNRTDWGAQAFANIKSVVRTCQKRGVSFFRYGMQLTGALLAGQPPPLPGDS